MTDYSTGAFHTGSAAPIDAIEQTEEVTQDSARATERYYSASAEIMRSLCLKLIDMTEANAKAAFELGRQLANARGPGEIIESCAAHVHRQFELLNTQVRDLAAHAQEISDRATPPRAHRVH
jgi:hypothetical protein